MQRAAIFVDAGYLFAQGSLLVTGGRLPRDLLSLDIPAVVAALRDTAAVSCSLPLLRIYWYDAARHGRLTPEHERLADTDDVKLRLGQINAQGQQKGVDVLLVTDLAELARNRAIADAVLISGDEDVRMGVVLAQQLGVRVHLIGIGPARSSQSLSLIREADTTIEWAEGVGGRFLERAVPIPAAADAGGIAADLELAIDGLIDGLSPIEIARLKASFAGSSTIPADYDRELLRIGRLHHDGNNLTDAERAALRNRFVQRIQDLQPDDDGGEEARGMDAQGERPAT